MASAPAWAAEGSRRLQFPHYIAPLSGAAKKVFSCEGLPVSPVRDLIFYSIYKKGDPHRAQVDKNKKKEYEAATRDLYLFEEMIAEAANNYLRTGAAAYAHCTVDWLNEWAQAGALLGEVNDMGVSIRHWSLASLSSAYAQILAARDILDPAKLQAIDSWLRQIADAVMKDYPNDTDSGRKRNNHLYWAAWSVTMTGLVLDDRRFYDWGINKAKYAIYVQMQEDGSLPLEMNRGKKALHYHVFAAIPLVMIAEAGAANGDNLYMIRQGMLHRFIDLIAAGLDDPSYFNKKSGFKQSPIKDMANSHFAWMEPYNAHFPNPALQSWLNKVRPVINRRTGGDMTLLYGGVLTEQSDVSPVGFPPDIEDIPDEGDQAY